MTADVSVCVLSRRSVHLYPETKQFRTALGRNGSSTSKVRHAVRRSHVIICDRRFQDHRDEFLCASNKFTCPVHPHFLALKVASTGVSRRTDLDAKKYEYAKAGIQTYVIVDRDLSSRKDP